MLSEDFDRKIKEAADHHHPAYDEKAWAGMKKLLDRHMPEEKDDKRRYLFFLLLFLLLGGGAAWYFMGRSAGDKKKEQAATVQVPVNINENKQEPGNTVRADDEPNGKSNEKPAEQQKEAAVAGKNKMKTPAVDSRDKAIPRVTDPSPADPVRTASADRKKTNAESQKNNRKEKIPDAAVKNNVPVSPDTKMVQTDTRLTKAPPAEPVTRKDDPAIVADAAVVVAGNSIKDQVAPADSKKEETEKPGNDDKKPQPVTTVKKEEKKPDEKAVAAKTKKPSAKKSSFFFSVSGGPDVSFTGHDKPGRMQFVGGAGIGFTYKERFTLRSGFYSGRKVYTSSPGEYNPPDIFYTYYPNLQKVEADCRVYEIPLSLGYHFGQQKKHSWFASTGISTILMKKETYDYYYKYYPTGPTVQKEHTFENENKHFFSVMTLSAGYQRTLGKRVSLTAEPYFKLPLSGIGYGKVKLNSAGVLFSLSIKPFQRPGKK